MLASDNASQAMNFFRAQLANAGSDAPAALRFGARLGLAEALLSSDKVREAQIEFARVAALDHTDRDNVARALVGQARCALQTSDSGARANARAWLETVTSQYGDTPSVLSAQEILESL